MFVPEKRRTWLRSLLQIRGSSLPRVWPRVALITTIAIIDTALREEFGYFEFSLTPTPFVLIGLPLGVFLGFRNGASYDRFWEGRRLWGALVNTSRSLTRQVQTLVVARDAGTNDDDGVRAFQAEIVRRIIGYAHALRVHLRDQRDATDALAFLPPDEAQAYVAERNVPMAMLHRMGQRLAEAWRRGWIDPLHVAIFEGSLTAMTDIQGACERIKATPVPFSYSVLIHRIVALYCFLLPFGLVETVHRMTPVVVLFISYAFFGLDQIGDEIEEPFGLDVNDLPLGAISRTIEIDARQRLGETDLPEPARPHDGVLV